MNKGLSGVLALGLATISLPAMAADYNIGQLNGLYVNTATVSRGSVNDNYFFSLKPGDIAVDIVNSKLAFPKVGTLYDIAGLTGKLFSLGGEQVGQAVSTPTSFASLASGDYRFNVTGTANGNQGGIYTLSLLPEAAVPVPGPAGFLVAAAGAVSLALRNRKKRRTSFATA